MKDITMHEVGMENYGPYIDPMILTFKNDTVTLLVGPNGVGKTMALDAIPFTLFGTTSKGLKGDDVVNNVVQKNCHTWVKFTHNEDLYHVKKYQSYSKFGGNSVVLNKNGVDIKSGSREVIPEIERIWCPEKSFMNTTMFGQKVKDFFTDLTDSKQKEIFRKLLGLDNYVSYYKQADLDMKDVIQLIQERQSQINVKQGLLTDAYTRITELEEAKKQFKIDIDNQIKLLQQSVQQSDRIIKSWEENIIELKKSDYEPEKVQIEIDRVQNDIEVIKSKNHIEENELQNQKNQKIYEIKSESDTAREGISDEYNKIKDQAVAEWRNDQAVINIDIAELTEKKHEIELKIMKFKAIIITHEANVKKINESVFESQISSCPVCLQAITDEIKGILKSEIIESEKLITDSNKEVDILTGLLGEHIKDIEGKQKRLKITDQHYSNELEELNQKHLKNLQDINSRVKDVMEKIEIAASKQLKILQAESVKKMDSLIEYIMGFKVVQAQAKENKQKLDEAIEGLNTSKTEKQVFQKQIEQKENEEYDESQLNGYKARIIVYTKEIGEITDSISVDKRKHKVSEFWKAGYSPTGIPSMLIDEAIPFMNQKVAQYLEEISNGRYIISFDTQDTIKSGEVRDKISVKVLDTITRANQRLQLSGGQTRLVDIATILTLGDLQAKNLDLKVNLLIFDEIFDSLDDQNIDYVSKVLTKLKKGRSIYLISHTQKDQLEADEVLEFKA